MTPTKGYAKVRAEWLQRLLKYPLVALASHWVFQSLFYMDRTERLFKILLDLIVTAILGWALSALLPVWFALTLAFVIAHSLNFSLNGHLLSVLKFFGLIELTQDVFSCYTERLLQRCEAEPAISQCHIVGSYSRGEWTPASDLDLRLVRRPGLRSGLRACFFALSERSRAMFSRFPLDIYVLDSPAAFERMKDASLDPTVSSRS